MAYHEACNPQEVFLGNTTVEGGSMTYLAGRLKTVRLGKVAYCIEGKRLPSDYAPVFLNRSESGLYDAIMIQRIKR